MQWGGAHHYYPKSNRVRDKDTGMEQEDGTLAPHPPSPQSKHMEVEAAPSMPILASWVLPLRTLTQQSVQQSTCKGQPREGLEVFAHAWCPPFKHIHPKGLSSLY